MTNHYEKIIVLIFTSLKGRVHNKIRCMLEDETLYDSSTDKLNAKAKTLPSVYKFR